MLENSYDVLLCLILPHFLAVAALSSNLKQNFAKQINRFYIESDLKMWKT
jgi:hypothetical protein